MVGVAFNSESNANEATTPPSPYVHIRVTARLLVVSYPSRAAVVEDLDLGHTVCSCYRAHSHWQSSHSVYTYTIGQFRQRQRAERGHDSNRDGETASRRHIFRRTTGISSPLDSYRARTHGTWRITRVAKYLLPLAIPPVYHIYAHTCKVRRTKGRDTKQRPVQDPSTNTSWSDVVTSSSSNFQELLP